MELKELGWRWDVGCWIFLGGWDRTVGMFWLAGWLACYLALEARDVKCLNGDGDGRRSWR